MSATSSNKLQVGIIGTGNIANAHMDVLSQIKNIQVIACCDTNPWMLEKFSKKWGISQVYNSVEELTKENKLDVIHILVPPNYHYSIAKEIIRQDTNIFLEKPMAVSSHECKELIELARKKGVKIGVNHNTIFHPAFLRLCKDIKNHRIGKVYNVVVNIAGPLGQLDFEKFSHWMFQSPKNIILEQAIHPISQVTTILGEMEEIQAAAFGKKELTPVQFFYDSWQARVKCKKGMAFLHLSFGKRYFPQNRLVVNGQDGAILIDLLNNLYLIQENSILADYLNPISNALTYANCVGQSYKNFINYALSKIKLHERSDIFYLSMKNSLYAFYNSLIAHKSPPVSGNDGLRGIEFCEKWIEASKVQENPEQNISIIEQTNKINPDILITGANGFIGRYLVEKFVSEGKSVRVLVRSQKGIKESLRSPLVEIMTGDLTNPKEIGNLVKGIKYIYHLAHGMGENWNEFYKINVLATKYLAEASLKENITYFIFTSTIATYCYSDFPRGCKIRELDPIDSKIRKRNFYARSKILAERMLMEMREKKGLPLIIFRPAIVIGKGGMLNHSGIGQWKGETVCAFWGMGKNELPFILVEDVASALVKVLEVGGLEGEVFNLAGDILFSAREYIEYLKKYTKRNIKSFSYPMPLLFLSDMLKFYIKFFTGEGKNALLSYRDLYNRSIPIHFDCSKAKKLLSWKPCNDKDEFLQKAIGWVLED